jgi:hypothetical protein
VDNGREAVTTSIIAVSAVVIIAVLKWISIQRERDLNSRFPPISDDEFMALCRPGSNREVALKVRRIVAKCLPVEYEQVYPSTAFIDDLGAD